MKITVSFLWIIFALDLGCSTEKIPDFLNESPPTQKDDYSSEVAAYAAILLFEDILIDPLVTGEMSADDINEGMKAKTDIIFTDLDTDSDGVLTKMSCDLLSRIMYQKSIPRQIRTATRQSTATRFWH